MKKNIITIITILFSIISYGQKNIFVSFNIAPSFNAKKLIIHVENNDSRCKECAFDIDATGKSGILKVASIPKRSTLTYTVFLEGRPVLGGSIAGVSTNFSISIYNGGKPNNSNEDMVGAFINVKRKGER